MKTKRYDKRFLPMLWIGLVIWLGSILISLLMEWTGNSPSGQETLMQLGKMMFQDMPVFTLLLLCLFQPILEEFSFRLWGEGKKRTAIVCLVLMTIFIIGEMGLWGLLFIAALALAWFGVRDRFIQMWACALISSVGFSLCHLSGFGGEVLGTVIGLTEIFGFALVLSWLAINFSIWLAALLHVLNNSLAILIPMIFLSDPSTVSCYSVVDGVEKLDYTITLEPLKPFADNSGLLANVQWPSLSDSTMTDIFMMGEPAEIAADLFARRGGEEGVYYDWKGKGESLEERVVLRGEGCEPGIFASQYSLLCKDYLALVEKYTGEPLVFDTTEIMLSEIWLIYNDGREVLLDDNCEDRFAAQERVLSSGTMGVRGNRIIQETEMLDDSSFVTHYYCLQRPNPLAAQLSSLNSMMDNMSGYRIDYRDGKKAKLVVIH